MATHYSVLAPPPQEKGGLKKYLTSFVAWMVKHLPTVRETWVQSLDGEDLLEKGMAIHCSILAAPPPPPLKKRELKEILLEKEMAIHSSTIAWKIPWTEEPGRLQSIGLPRVGHD